LAAVVVAGGALGGCARSDEDEIRDASKTFFAALRDNDGQQACAITTIRASVQLRAQLATFQEASGSCENIVRNTRTGSPAAAAVDRARLTVRGDRAVLTFGGDADPLGLRRVGGSWRVDNVLNPRINETPRRRDQTLAEGSNATQIKATMHALSGAVSKRDYRRICDLIGPGFEAALLVNAIFSRIFTHPDEKPSDVSCTGAFREIERVAELRDNERTFERLLSTLGPVGASPKVSIRGADATIRSRAYRGSLIKLDGQWLLDSDPAAPAPPSELTRCWRRAGARIAIDASDLRFAAADRPGDRTRAHGRVSAKGDDWRIFYALLADGADPGLARVVADPAIVPVVAYIRDATAHGKIVEIARRCGD
jgi:hypothetical protein